jgi:uncharacterized protein (DUF2236 family)
VLPLLSRNLDTGRSGDPGLFGPDSLAWRVNGEIALLLGGGRALLMQLADPSVAAGVADHSGFPDDAFTRLWRTLDTMVEITFGDAEHSRRAAERVNAVHRGVNGVTPVGSPYRALDPHLLLWVHATLVDSALAVHDRFVGGLSSSERDRYYRDMKRHAAVLDVPRQILPGSLGDFDRYVRKQAGRLQVSDQARALAADVLSPPVPFPLRPASVLFRQITIGLLPARLRDAYGLRWDPVRGWLLAAAARTARTLTPVVPALLRRWPYARAAERRVLNGGNPRARP